MTTHEPTPAEVTLVAIDIAKIRNEVLIEVPGQRRRRRLTVLNTRADHDSLVAALNDLGCTVVIGFEATGNYHRALAWRLLSAGFAPLPSPPISLLRQATLRLRPCAGARPPSPGCIGKPGTASTSRIR